MDSLPLALRQTLARAAEGRGRPCYPEALRQHVAAHVRDRRARSTSLRRLADELALAVPTLGRPRDVTVAASRSLYGPGSGPSRGCSPRATHLVHARAVCTARGLARGDEVAWAAFVAGLEGAPLAPSARALLADPSGC